MGDPLARLDRGFTRHPGHPRAPQDGAALVDAGDVGMRHREFHMRMALRRLQSAVGLALVAEGAELNRPVAGFGGFDRRAGIAKYDRPGANGGRHGRPPLQRTSWGAERVAVCGARRRERTGRRWVLSFCGKTRSCGRFLRRSPDKSSRRRRRDAVARARGAEITPVGAGRRVPSAGG